MRISSANCAQPCCSPASQRSPISSATISFSRKLDRPIRLWHRAETQADPRCPQPPRLRSRQEPAYDASLRPCGGPVMLSREDNERLVRVGSGTPAGELFRRYWQPACLSTELPECDSVPVRVRLLGEDLIAFRDSNGRVGLVDAYCPHRR